MSKYRDAIAAAIAEEIARHPEDIRITDLRTALMKHRDEELKPEGAHYERIWMGEASKAVQRVLKVRRAARLAAATGLPGLFPKATATD